MSDDGGEIGLSFPLLEEEEGCNREEASEMWKISDKRDEMKPSSKSI